MFGTKGKDKAIKTLSVSAGRVPSNAEIKHQVVAWINELCSEEVSAGVTTVVVRTRPSN